MQCLIACYNSLHEASLHLFQIRLCCVVVTKMLSCSEKSLIAEVVGQTDYLFFSHLYFLVVDYYLSPFSVVYHYSLRVVVTQYCEKGVSDYNYQAAEIGAKCRDINTRENELWTSGAPSRSAIYI